MFCTITLLDIELNVNINWFGLNGLIIMNNTEYNVSTGEINLTTTRNSLTFTTSLSDNGTDYYCTARVGPANTVNGFVLIIPATAISSSTTVLLLWKVN